MEDIFEQFKRDVKENKVESYMYMQNPLNLLYTLSWIYKDEEKVIRKFGDINSEQLVYIINHYKELYGRYKYQE